MEFNRKPSNLAENISKELFSESLQQSEHPRITPDILFEDNRSSYAYERRELWETARSNGALTVIKACGDARLALPDETSIHIRSIATGGPIEPFQRLINHQGIQDIVVIAHHDGDTVAPGEVPTGCGGLGAKAVTKDGHGSYEGIHRFVDEHIHHPDVIRNAYQSAFLTSVHTEKPVLAATQDHLTGIIYPIAAFWDSGKKASAAVPLKHMLDEYYDPEQIYEDGIPVLNMNDIPDNFLKFLDESRRQTDILQRKYRNYRQNQKVQDPHTLAIKAGIRPFGVTQPDTLRDPNNCFDITISRDRIESTIRIPDEVLDTAFDQAEYPITHTLQHADQSGKSFASLRTVIIETPDINQSWRAASRLKERTWMKEWINLTDREIIIVQKQRGIATQLEIFD